MSLDKLKPAWAMFKSAHSFDLMPDEEILRLIDSPKLNRSRSVLVNLMMLLTFLMVCY